MGAVPLLGELGPHLAQCGLHWGLPPYQVTSWSIQRFGHRHEPKIGRGLCPFFGGQGAGSPSTTMSLGSRRTFLYQVASWSTQPFGHNRYGPKIGGCAPLGRGPQPKRHLDRLSHSCRAHYCDRPTDHATVPVITGRIYIYTVLRCGVIIRGYILGRLWKVNIFGWRRKRYCLFMEGWQQIANVNEREREFTFATNKYIERFCRTE